jgi:hypothetical protein
MIGQILIDVVRKNRLKFVYSIFKRRYFNLILVTLILIISLPRLIEPETLTITTYYPAPYGGYVSILTTGNTWLARDTGNVGIGTANPTKKLDVIGSIKASDRIGTQGYDPDSGYPSGWRGGIHTWDVYAHGSVRADGALCIGSNCRTSWGNLSCIRTTCSTIPKMICRANCPSGYTLTGGGINHSGISAPSLSVYWLKSYPSDNGWACGTSFLGRATCYAICCKIQ